MSTAQDTASSDWRLKFGEWLFRKRDYTPIPLILVALFLIRPSVQSVAAGAALVLLGEGIRFWGVSYIGGISRTRTKVTGKLMDSGPFSIVRNPLYVGNFFLSLGFVVVSGVWWLIPVYIVLFSVQYHYIVQWEEENLRNVMGEPYVAYCKEVPRWFPKFSNYRPGEHDFGKAFRSERNTLGAIVAVAVILAVANFYGVSLS